LTQQQTVISTVSVSSPASWPTEPTAASAWCLQGEANELRKQLTLARSLRNGSSPEFDEKMTRLKQLREMRKGYLDKIQGESSCCNSHEVK
jgi:hypothetical protein